MREEIKRILLIDPPVSRPEEFSAERVRVSVIPPLGLMYLAAVLERRNYEVKILDCTLEGYKKKTIEYSGGKIRYGLSDEDIAKRILDFSPHVVGISCLFSAKIWDMENISRLVKSIDQKIITVVGGAHPGATAKKTLENNSIDFVIIGEGEVSFINLLETLKSGKKIDILDGVAFRQDGRIIVRPKTKYILNLDEIPFPARHLVSMPRYFEYGVAHSGSKQKPFTQMISSRGCPTKCTFCVLENHWGKIQRMRSAKNVLDEIEFLITTYGIKEIHFEDDNLTANKKRAIEIFDGMIKRGFNISWQCPSGIAVYSLDDEILEKMKKSGCYNVPLGIESGDQEVLSKLMHKPVNLKKVPELVKRIRAFGMRVKGFFILGFPDETKESIKRTIEFAKSLELDWTLFFIATPLPGSFLYQLCLEKGYIKEEDFDPIRSFHKSFINTAEFNSEYLEKVKKEANLDLNFKNNPNLKKYNIDLAIEDFQQVLDLYPHLDFANFYLAEALYKKGDIHQAYKYWQKTLELNPTHAEAKQRLFEDHRPKV